MMIKKMRVLTKTLLFAAVLIMLAASKKGGYTLQGTVEGAKEGDTVFLVEMQGFGMLPLDTALITKGKYLFKGVQDEPGLHERRPAHRWYGSHIGKWQYPSGYHTQKALCCQGYG